MFIYKWKTAFLKRCALKKSSAWNKKHHVGRAFMPASARHAKMRNGGHECPPYAVLSRVASS
jgi:hypothetical protein